MRILATGFIAVLAVLVLLFVVQNLQLVTVSLLGASATLPVWFLVVVIYALGLVTGGTLVSLLRGGFRRARARPVSAESR